MDPSSIHRALTEKVMGKNGLYSSLITVLKQVQKGGNSNAEYQECLYPSLLPNMAMVAKRPKLYSELLHHLFMYPKATVNGHMECILELISNNATFVVPYFEMLVKDRFGGERNDILQVLKMVPSSVQLLYPALCQHFPHRIKSVEMQVDYLQGLVTLMKTVPSLEGKIVGLIIEKLVLIDVEIKLEREEMELTMDDFLTDNGDKNGDMQEMKRCEMAEKLDQMMLHMLEYIQGRHKENLLFQGIVSAFDNLILNTYQSKYPQFLIFYICHFSVQYQQLFISQLIHALLNVQVSFATRGNCAAYIASFVSRASYLDNTVIRKTLQHLVNYLHGMLANVSGKSIDPVFYHIFQCICYIICFRGPQIVVQCPEDDQLEGVQFLQGLRLDDLIDSEFAPLHRCIDTIADEFIRIGQLLDICASEEDDEHVTNASLERMVTIKNEITTTTTTTHIAKTRSDTDTFSNVLNEQQTKKVVTTSQRKVECFFPFDPYLLKTSWKYIGPLYQYWKQVDPFSLENQLMHQKIDEIVALQTELHASILPDNDDMNGFVKASDDMNDIITTSDEEQDDHWVDDAPFLDSPKKDLIEATIEAYSSDEDVPMESDDDGF